MNTLTDLVIYCDRGSHGARVLAAICNARRLRASPTKALRPIRGALVVNFGSSAYPSWGSRGPVLWLNRPDYIPNAVSKLRAYELFTQQVLPTLEFTTDSKVAGGWSGDSIVLGRRDGLKGGKGIHLFEKGQPVVPGNATFFTRYFPKTHEYRFHVFNVGTPELYEGRVIDITQKKRAQVHSPGQITDRTLHQRIVRSHDNGWVFAHKDLHLPPDAKSSLTSAAISAVKCLGLDFGAVDILANYSKKVPDKLLGFAICEVNTGPGLENTSTIQAYKDAIMEVYEKTKVDRKLTMKVKSV